MNKFTEGRTDLAKYLLRTNGSPGWGLSLLIVAIIYYHLAWL
jgi:hypothetical protein